MRLVREYSDEEKAKAQRLHVLFTAKIMNEMDNLGMTRADLARATGFTPGYITQTLNGDRHNLSLNAIARLGSAVGIVWHVGILWRNE